MFKSVTVVTCKLEFPIIFSPEELTLVELIAPVTVNSSVLNNSFHPAFKRAFVVEFFDVGENLNKSIVQVVLGFKLIRTIF